LIQDHSAGFSGGLDQGSRNQQQASSQSQPTPNLTPVADSGEPYQTAAMPPVTAPAQLTDARLDIRI
jgi:hypothetical protein